jgi:hypothetical protein
MTTLSLQVGATADDNCGNSSLGLLGGTVGIEGQYAGFNLRSFTRFQNVTITGPITVSVADWQEKAQDTDSSTTYDVGIYFNDVDDAANPADGTALMALALTTAFTQSTNLSTTSGSWHTRSIITAAQEVFDRAGWASGNDQSVVTERLSGTASRRWNTYDAAPADGAKLDYTYTAGGGGGTSKNLLTLGVG